MQSISACIGIRNWDERLLGVIERTLVAQGIDDIRVCNQGETRLNLKPPLYEMHVPLPDWRSAIAHNTGALTAAHNVLLHTNCGLVFSPGLIERAVAMLQPGKNFVCPTIRYYRCTREATETFLEAGDVDHLKEGAHLSTGQTWFGDFLLIHKFDFVRVGGYDPEFWGWGRLDRDFTDRAIAVGLKQEIVDGDLYHLWDGYPTGRQNDPGYRFNDELMQTKQRSDWWRNERRKESWAKER